jgi:hypothetical protein
MGIGNVTLHWLEVLHRQGVFADKHSILELGPSDTNANFSVDVYSNFFSAVKGGYWSREIVKEMFFPDGQANPWSMLWVYGALGLDDYKAVDLHSGRANYRIDLNFPYRLDRKFNIIAEFGTIEHIFNIGNAMNFIHEHLDVGGISLHQVPTIGSYGHGFFNIHGTFFRDLARANDYEVLSLVTIPDFQTQDTLAAKYETLGDIFPRSTVMVDISRADMDDMDARFARTLMERIQEASDLGVDGPQLIANPTPDSTDPIRPYWRHPPGPQPVESFIFAALRKVKDSPFVYPVQGLYADGCY